MSNNDRPRAERDKPSLVIGSRSITAYDPGLALEVCEKIAEGNNLKDTLKLDGYPCRSTWYRWCMLYPDLKIAYDIARAISAEGMEEDMLEVAKVLLEGGKSGLTALQLDAIKAGMAQLRWSAARRDPAKFAERPQVQTVIPVQINTTLNMGQGGLPAVQGSIYHMLAAKPTGEITDAEYEPLSTEGEGEEGSGAGTGGSEHDSGLPVVPLPPRPNLAKKPYPQRLRKGHKTKQQTLATMAAYAQRGKGGGFKGKRKQDVTSGNDTGNGAGGE